MRGSGDAARAIAVGPCRADPPSTNDDDDDDEGGGGVADVNVDEAVAKPECSTIDGALNRRLSGEAGPPPAPPAPAKSDPPATVDVVGGIDTELDMDARL